MFRYKFKSLSSLDIIDQMTGLEFEKYVLRLLKHRGFSGVKLTEKYDMGVDIIASKNGTCYGVQVKRYRRLVKAEAVRQVISGLSYYKCDKALVITNSYYSRPACILAASNNCLLIDRDQLKKLMI